MPLPYMLAIAMMIGAFGGYKITSNHYDAAMLDAERAAHTAYIAEVKRGNEASERVITAENQIREISKWKGKQIEKVTTGKPCLSAAAVGLLNMPAGTAPTDTGEPVAESPAVLAASDRDVADWAADAQERYSVTAGRCNALIDLVRPQVETGQERDP